jgi:pyruvate formate lyase activating enzyme
VPPRGRHQDRPQGFSEKFYKEVVNGELKPVLNALATIRKLGMWNEIVYLVIPP